MTIFEHQIQARNPGTYLLFGLAGLMVAAVLITRAPPIAWLPVLAFLAAVLWRIGTNPKTGFRLSEDRLEIFAPGMHRVFTLTEIDSIAIGHDGHGGTRCMMHISDGRSQVLPCAARFAPQSLRQQFSRRGVRILI